MRTQEVFPTQGFFALSREIAPGEIARNTRHRGVRASSALTVKIADGEGRERAESQVGDFGRNNFQDDHII